MPQSRTPATPPSLPAIPPPPTDGRLRVSRQRRDGRDLARLLSLICPGLGQLVTGRIWAGLGQFVLFVVAVVIVVQGGVRMLVRMYTSALRAADDPTATIAYPAPAELMLLLSGMVLAVLALAWSLWDAGKQPSRQGRPQG